MQYLEMHGHEVPALGLGTWQLRGSQCRSAVEQGLELGYRHIDTAQMYANEHEIGRALETVPIERSELFLTTKIANRNHAPDRVVRSTEQSLRELGTEYVDLLLIHWPVDYAILPATLEAMLGLREQGKVRHVGVSNFSPQQFHEAAERAPIFTNQVEYHPFLNQDAVLDAVRARGAMLTAYSPIARGRVTRDSTLLQIAERHGKTPAQVALRWLLQQDGVSAIPKASGRDHLQENLDVFDVELSEDECERIYALTSRGTRIVSL